MTPKRWPNRWTNYRSEICFVRRKKNNKAMQFVPSIVLGHIINAICWQVGLALRSLIGGWICVDHLQFISVGLSIDTETMFVCAQITKSITSLRKRKSIYSCQYEKLTIQRHRCESRCHKCYSIQTLIGSVIRVSSVFMMIMILFMKWFLQTGQLMCCGTAGSLKKEISLFSMKSSKQQHLYLDGS